MFVQMTDKEMNKTKPKLSITYDGFWSHPNRKYNHKTGYFTRMLSTAFQVEIVDNNADLLIYSVYGKLDYNKKAKKKLYFPNEVSGYLYNEANKFKLSNYADAILTCNPTEENHIKFPHFIIYIDWWNHKNSTQISGESPAYCVNIDEVNLNYTFESVFNKKISISAFFNNPAYPRPEIINSLRNSFDVSSYGSIYNNTYGPFGGDEFDKIRESDKHLFNLAIENCIYNGYCSEKILHAFASAAIPIYWGDTKTVHTYFNKELLIELSEASIKDNNILRAHIKQRTKEIYQVLISNEDVSPINTSAINKEFNPTRFIKKLNDLKMLPSQYNN